MKLDTPFALHNAGFQIFPVAPNSKIPAIKQWQHPLSADEMARWFGGPTTSCNIGIHCGKLLDRDAYLCVIDIDVKDGRDGRVAMDQLAILGKDFPPTLSAKTPTGGLHLFYWSSVPIKNGVNCLGVGIDRRGLGGYVVAAGSEIDGKKYEWINENPMAEALDWMVQPASPRAQKVAKSHLALVDVNQDMAWNRAVEYLDSLEVAAQGGRNDAAYRASCKIKDFGLSFEKCVEVMRQYFVCEPALETEEIRHVVASAFNYSANPPGIDAPEVAFNEPAVEVEKKTKHPFERLNDEYAFVTAGGGHHILQEITDEEGKFTLDHLSEPSFHKRHAAETMMIGEKPQPITQLWMKSKERRSYTGICFAPGKDHRGLYNLWRGFTVKPKKTGSREALAAVQNFLEHIRLNVCRGDVEHFNWLVGYFAHLVQRPWEKPLVALVMRGGKGVGKSFIVECIGHLLGIHFLLTSNRRFLLSHFNGHLQHLLLFTLEEAFWSGDKQAEGVLKDLITGKTHVIEHKGKEPYTVANLLRVVIIGNEDWIVPASGDERRFAVFDVGNGRKQDRPFFQSILDGMKDGGYELLLDYLMNAPISDVNAAPATEALTDQKLSSLGPIEQWWLEVLQSKSLSHSGIEGWPVEALKSTARDSFYRYFNERMSGWAPNESQFGRRLKLCCPSMGLGRVREGKVLPYTYRFPTIEQARKDFETHIGGKILWED